MDPAGLGALIGVSVMLTIAFGIYTCENCKRKLRKETTTNPLLVKKRSFKIKNLFQHVEI
jgi:hypothetical protein